MGFWMWAPRIKDEDMILMTGKGSLFRTEVGYDLASCLIEECVYVECLPPRRGACLGQSVKM